MRNDHEHEAQAGPDSDKVPQISELKQQRAGLELNTMQCHNVCYSLVY